MDINNHKFLGREDELSVFFDTINSNENHNNIVFVSGNSGVGKTTFIRHGITQVINNSYYSSYGKFDKYNTDQSYRPIKEVLEWLIRELLTEPTALLEDASKRLVDLFQDNVNIISHFAPSIKQIIPVKSTYNEIDHQRGKRNLYKDISKFFRFFLERRQNMIVFIDDIQWADVYSIELLEHLMDTFADKPINFLYTYRSNEIEDNSAALDFVENHSHTATSIEVKNFRLKDLELYLTRTYPAISNQEQFSQVVYRKTLGNPFYIEQFLKSIEYDQVFLDSEVDIDMLNSHETSTDVIYYVLKSINQLDSELLNLLKVCSCIGNIFELKVIQLYYDNSKQLHNRMKSLVEKGYIYMLGNQDDIYCFSHDKIYQGVSSIIDNHEKSHIHIVLGRLMLQLDPTYVDDHILQIMSHFNYDEHIDYRQEMYKHSKYYLMAGRKAKLESDFITMDRLIDKGLNLIEDHIWKEDPKLVYELNYEKIQSEFVLGRIDEATIRFNVITTRIEEPLDVADTYMLMAVLFASKGNYAKAIEMGVGGSNYLGVKVSHKPSKVDIVKSLAICAYKFRNSNIDNLYNLPELKAPKIEKALEILVSICPALSMYDDDMYIQVLLKIAVLSLSYGNSRFAGDGYMSYGIVCSNYIKDYNKAEKISVLIENISNKYPNKKFEYLREFVTGVYFSHWNHHASKDIEYYNQSKEHALEFGDYLFVSYSLALNLETTFRIGRSISEMEELCLYTKEENKIIKTQMVDFTLAIFVGMLNALKGRPINITNDTKLSRALEDVSLADKMSYYICKAEFYYLSGEHVRADEMISLGMKNIGVSGGLFMLLDFYLYDALIKCQMFTKYSKPQQVKAKKLIKSHMNQMKKWMKTCPDNAEHKYWIIYAEYHRIKGSTKGVIEAYEVASAKAKYSGFNQHVALANRLAARYCLELGLSEQAKYFGLISLDYYKIWGASYIYNQVRNEFSLENCTHEIIKDVEISNKIVNIQEIHETSVDKVPIVANTLSEVLSSLSEEFTLEHNLDLFLTKIMKQTNSTTGHFLIKTDTSMLIKASSNDELLNNGLEACSKCCVKMMRYVSRTKEISVVDTNTSNNLYNFDMCEDILNPKVILCAPLVSKGELLGVLYLDKEPSINENECFCEEDINCTELLLKQVAIMVKLNQYTKDGKDEQYVNPLTQREMQVINLLAKGMSNKEISKKLELSSSTIKTHTLNIYRKFEVNSRIKAVNKAKEVGIIEVD